MVVALSAWRLTRRRAHHLPFALFATLAALADLGQPLSRFARGLIIAPSAVPYHHGALFLYHVDQALFLAYPAALAALALHVLARARVESVLGAYGLAVAVLVGIYPDRGERVLLVAHVLAVVVAGGAVLYAARTRARGIWPTMTEILALLYIATEIMIFVGPYAAPTSTAAAWPSALPSYLALNVATLLVHAAWSGALGRPAGERSVVGLNGSGGAPDRRTSSSAASMQASSSSSTEDGGPRR